MTKTILIIDDDKMLRDALTTGLRGANFDVVTADSAKSGQEILNRISVDAIVLDRMMEDIDGLTFLKQLRTNGNETPVIMLTAMSGAENAIDGLTSGANDYMAKPFKFQELLLRLNNIMKNSNFNNNDKSTKFDKLIFADDEFFILENNNQKKLLALSNEEKKLLQNLINPIGNIVSATPMVAKRLRNKINGVLSDIDIITIRGMGYKIIATKQ